MARLKFYMKPLKGGSCHINARFQQGKDILVKFTGYSIPGNKINNEYKYWSKKQSRVKGHADAAEIYFILDDWQMKYNKYLTDCNLTNTPYNNLTAVGVVTGAQANTLRAPALVDVAEQFRKDMKGEHDIPTSRSYATMIDQITQYQQQLNTTIRITDIDRTFYRRYTLWLIEEHDNINSTIAKKIGRVITVIKYAIEDLKIKGISDDYNIRPNLKEIQASKFPLNDAELSIIRAHTVADPYRRMVLDAFLLATETGLRHSDIQQLQAVHIKSFVVGNGRIIRYIQVSTEKTDKDNTIPLSDRAAEIIDKYLAYKDAGVKIKPASNARSHKEMDPRHIFPFHYLQSSTIILKDLFKDAKLVRQCEVVYSQGNDTVKETKPLCDVISFHTARNTYITRLLQNNVAPSFVKDNAGHANISTTMGYFRDEDIKRYLETLEALNKVSDN